jgi:hypothetical protein
MGLSKYFSTSVYALIIVLALSGARFVSINHEKPPLFISKQQSSVNFQNNFWEYFSLGQKRLASSIMWISTILESDIDHYKKRDLNSWMFLRFNTISFLEPKFYENYAFGGVYLSIIKDDLPGASIIYDKGLSYYPEIQNMEKAFPIYKKLVTFKNISPIVISTFARLEKNNGSAEDAYKILTERYNMINDKQSIVARKTYEQIYSIKAEIDLDCLNSEKIKNKPCSTADQGGVAYILKNKTYYAAKSWKPFQVKKKGLK